MKTMKSCSAGGVYSGGGFVGQRCPLQAKHDHCSIKSTLITARLAETSHSTLDGSLRNRKKRRKSKGISIIIIIVIIIIVSKTTEELIRRNEDKVKSIECVANCASDCLSFLFFFPSYSNDFFFSLFLSLSFMARMTISFLKMVTKSRNKSTQCQT